MEKGNGTSNDIKEKGTMGEWDKQWYKRKDNGTSNAREKDNGASNDIQGKRQWDKQWYKRKGTMGQAMI